MVPSKRPSSSSSASSPPPPLLNCLAAGAVSGTIVDLVLFPLDTLKTRLQSEAGLRSSGGFRSLYAGCSSTLIGSAPGAALFFLTYESLKRTLRLSLPTIDERFPSLIYLGSSSLAEVSACAIRVPVEVLKQRMQVAQYPSRLPSAVRLLYRQEGILGFYRGFQATVQREIPFACIQFPLYEWFKTQATITNAKIYTSTATSTTTTSIDLEPWQAALCGSAAGGITAALTTPFDVLKTRIMLGALNQSDSPLRQLGHLVRTGGVRQLFAGLVPRVAWISAGGFIFFGVYEQSMALFNHRLR